MNDEKIAIKAELLRSLVGSLVNHPEDVVLDVEKENASRYVFRLRTNESDMRLLIGQNGKIGEALRAIIRSWSGQLRLCIVYIYVTDREDKTKRHGGGGDRRFGEGSQ